MGVVVTPHLVRFLHILANAIVDYSTCLLLHRPSFCPPTLTLNNTVLVNNMPGHLHDELAANPARVVVNTMYGPVSGGRADNGTAVFLGA
jgi:hypothetical protein